MRGAFSAMLDAIFAVPRSRARSPPTSSYNRKSKTAVASEPSPIGGSSPYSQRREAWPGLSTSVRECSAMSRSALGNSHTASSSTTRSRALRNSTCTASGPEPRATSPAPK